MDRAIAFKGSMADFKKMLDEARAEEQQKIAEVQHVKRRIVLKNWDFEQSKGYPAGPFVELMDWLINPHMDDNLAYPIKRSDGIYISGYDDELGAGPSQLAYYVEGICMYDGAGTRDMPYYIAKGVDPIIGEPTIFILKPMYHREMQHQLTLKNS